MELIIKILLFGCTFQSFEEFVSSHEQYEVKIFRNITMVRSDGTLPYLEKYPRANSDKFLEDERLKHCRTGFDHVLKHEEGKSFQFSSSKSTGKLKVYVLVNPSSSEDTSDDVVEVWPAYECPTTPITYIHIHFERSKEDAPTFWVIFKHSGPAFNFSHINGYFLHLVEEVREATAEEISSTPDDNIGTSACDTDELLEEQRHQMCKRVMNMSPEIGAYFIDNIESKPSDYYLAFEFLGKESENHTKKGEAAAKKAKIEKVSIDSKQDSGSEDEAETGSGSSDDTDHRGIIQAFTCPSFPEIRIGVVNTDEEEYTLLAIVKKDEIKERPTLNIVGYELIIANFISEIREETENNKDEENHARTAGEKSSRQWGQNYPVSQKNAPEIYDHRSMEEFLTQNEEIRVLINQLEQSDRVLEALNEELSENDVSINTDEFTEEERHFVCQKAMKTVLGEDAKFVDGRPGRSARYRFFINQKDEYLISRGRYQFDKVIKGFTCPTQPVAYVRVARHRTETVVQVIVSGKELALSLLEFK